MTTTDLLRAARALEAQGSEGEADRLRWVVACAVSGGALREPAAVGDDLPDPVAPWCLDPSVLDLGALPVCERLAG